MVKVPKREKSKAYAIDTTGMSENESLLQKSKSMIPSSQLIENFAKEVAKKIKVINDFPKQGIKFYDITPCLVDSYLLSGIVVHSGLLLEKVLNQVDFVVSPEARGFYLGPLFASFLGAGFLPLRKEGKIPPYGHTSIITFESKSEYGSSRFQLNKEWISDMKNLYFENKTNQLFYKFIEVIKPYIANFIQVDSINKVKSIITKESISNLRFKDIQEYLYKDIKSQDLLKFQEVFENSKKEYLKSMLNINISECKILIVDDVLATGNTALSIASAFEEFGFSTPIYMSLLEIVPLGGRKLLESSGVSVCSLITNDLI